VFKGKEAKLNRAIIQTLGAKEPLSTRELQKKTVLIKGFRHTSYSTVNKRVRNLEQSGYLKKSVVKERTGGITNFYELRPKAYLATFFNCITIDDLIERVDDSVAVTIMGALIDARFLMIA
jgi:predicted transcriptional regulator